MSGLFPSLFPSREDGHFLFFDTETDGLPRYGRTPNLVQMAWLLTDETGREQAFGCRIIRPEGFAIPFDAAQVHGITTDRAMAEGSPLGEVLREASPHFQMAYMLVAHNYTFDEQVLAAACKRAGIPHWFRGKRKICTMKESTAFCRLPGRHGMYKWPRLTELHQALFGGDFEDAHDAGVDVRATARCFFALRERGIIRC